MKIRIKDMVLCSLFTALIAIGAFIRIPVPYLPFTLQLLFTMSAGLLLGGKLGALSVCVYILMGLSGMPVFTEGGGPAYILKPTFGYIAGFAAGAYVTGIIANKVPEPGYRRLLAANFAGLAIVYLSGISYYYFISDFYLGNSTGVKTILFYCFVLAVPGDIVLCLIGAKLGKTLIPIMKRYNR